MQPYYSRLKLILKCRKTEEDPTARNLAERERVRRSEGKGGVLKRTRRKAFRNLGEAHSKEEGNVGFLSTIGRRRAEPPDEESVSFDMGDFRTKARWSREERKTRREPGLRARKGKNRGQSTVLSLRKGELILLVARSGSLNNEKEGDKKEKGQQGKDRAGSLAEVGERRRTH